MRGSLRIFLVLGITTVATSYSSSSDQSWNYDSEASSSNEDQFSSEEISQASPEANDFLSKILRDPNLRDTADSCQKGKSTPVCDPDSPYRTYDGSCNNLKYPTWGQVRDCLVRILPASYKGRYGMPTATNGEPLPGARELTLIIFKDANRPTPEVTLFFTIFGQIVAHDMSLSTPPAGTAISQTLGINCCPPSKANSPDCASIIYPPDDPFFSKRNMTCLNFLRGLKCSACKDAGQRMIANNVTAALDLHLVYGTNQRKADQLRTNDGTGRLITRHTSSGELLPRNTDPKLLFCPAGGTTSCFKSGDVRVNQHAFLTALQTTMMREHNRIVEELRSINCHWDDEKLYQTARKILGAEFQAIVYKEYLPVLLGLKYMAKFGLQLKKGGGGTYYNPTLRFGTWTEYTSGTFRIHSMIPTKTGFAYKKFRDVFSNPYLILNGSMDQMLQGSCSVPSQQFDHFDVPDISNFAYKQPHQNYGIDLVSIDIQRGRDHGLPHYVDLLNYCLPGNSKISEFDDLCFVMSQQNIELLKQNYNTLQDVDLYVGMQMEDIMEGSVLSPTTACVVAGQFYFTKYGDRFYFEHLNEASSFTTAQRKTLMNSNIGRLICDNTEVKNLQKNPFLYNNDENPIVKCSQRPKVDLSQWRSIS